MLGVDPGASRNTIKNKYRELAKMWHPDKNPDCADCHAKFEKLVEAYETLMNDISRSSYDAVRMGDNV